MLAEGNCDLVGVEARGWAVSLTLIIPWHLPYKRGKLQKTCQSV
jgi:hypothetical protein